jgi:hypothetical protein
VNSGFEPVDDAHTPSLIPFSCINSVGKVELLILIHPVALEHRPAWRGFELAAGNGGALSVERVAAIEPVGPLPQVAREVLGADPMMGADQSGFMLLNSV